MKIRNGFISNSSSSSFVIKLDDLNGAQIYAILNHIDLAQSFVKMDDFYNDPWCVEIQDDELVGHTGMDNFDMREFMEKIDVRMYKVKWDW